MTAPSTSRIGPYHVTGVLGRGGMGVVYRGAHVESGAAVALKTLDVAGASTLASIRREIQALRLLRHPGVVRIVGQGVADGKPWYAMDLLEGETLRGRLDRRFDVGPARATAETRVGPCPSASVPASPPGSVAPSSGSALPPRAPTAPAPAAERAASPPHQGAPPPRLGDAEADRALTSLLTVVRRLCAPLAFLHGQGIVHRDLKPENVFLLAGDRPVLVDFGVSERAAGTRGREVLELGGRILGTPCYMSPEQIRGEFVDARADLYALGCLLHETLTGEPPFAATSAMALFDAHLHQQPLPPSELVPSLPAQLDALVLRLLEKRPQDRLGHASDVAALLAALPGMAEDEPPDAVAPAPEPYLYRPGFVGRGAALAELEAALAEAAAGRGSRVFVGGESGVGKTRLAMELAASAARAHVDVVAGECAPLIPVPGASGAARAVSALQPLRPLMLAAADHCRELGPAETARLLGDDGALLAAHEPTLAELPGHERWPAAVPPTSAAEARVRLYRALRRVLVTLASPSPLVLVLDDLQWADELSLGFLASLDGEALARARVLVLGTYRIEEASPALRELVSASPSRSLVLDRLDGESVGAVVADMLGLHQPPEGLLDFLQRASGGNPYFIAEYLRAAIARRVLDRGPAGRWRFRAGAASPGVTLSDALPLPTSLARLLDTRLDVLGDGARGLTDLAAVFGREIDGDLLLDASGLDEPSGAAALVELRARQVLEETGAGSLRFVHDQLRAHAYAAIAPERRAQLHGLAARFVEERRGGEIDARLHSELAFHYAEAGDGARAAWYYRLAGDHARATYANDDAIACYRAALVQSGGEGPEAVAASEGLGDVLALVGRHEPAVVAWGAALVDASDRAAGDRVGRARLHRKIGKVQETLLRYDAALTAYSAAEAELGDPIGAAAWHEWIRVQTARLSVHYWLARLDEGAAIVERLRPAVEAYGSPTERAHFFQALVQMSIRAERYRASARTVRYARWCLDATIAAGGVDEVANARFGLGLVLVFHGRLDEGEACLREALVVAEHTGDVMLQARCLGYLALAARLRHDVAGARPAAERCLAVSDGAGLDQYAGGARGHLAWTALRAGRLDEAREHADGAVRLWQEAGSPWPLEWTARLPRLAVALAGGRLPEAVDEARRMLDLRQHPGPDGVAEELSRAVRQWQATRDAAAREPLERAVALDA